ncbi:MAG: hypothetical protein IPM29_28560 [Planctomycetes bacterium]|nr:hypothetical protein [Planctomycetota bacterium]
MRALAVAVAGLVLAACSTPDATADLVRAELPLLGHRNWIAVVDMAYPAQIAPGIETIYAGGDQLAAVRAALSEIGRAPHVRARVLVDEELDFVDETDAPGIRAYRDALAATLAGSDVTRVPHEAILARLDAAAATFRVLVVKTAMTLPYTSVFLELDCGYWGGDAEQRLRDALAR